MVLLSVCFYILLSPFHFLINLIAKREKCICLLSKFHLILIRIIENSCFPFDLKFLNFFFESLCLDRLFLLK